MAWKVEVSPKAMRSLARLDKQVAARILGELERIGGLPDPRSCGKPLSGNLRGLWRYRQGDHRMVCHLDDGRLVVLVVDVAHRSVAYRRK